MRFPSFVRALAASAAAAALASASLCAQAASFRFSGTLRNNTDIVQLGFSLDTANDVKVWTDSWQSGLNFDPVIAVWEKAGTTYTLIHEVDDDDSIGPGQGYFDAGVHLPLAAAGQYLVTLAASDNHAKGTTLADGFAFDGSAPVPIAVWEQWSADPNTHDQKGGLWRIDLSGVTQAAPVPEPASGALMALGLTLCVLLRRRPR